MCDALIEEIVDGARRQPKSIRTEWDWKEIEDAFFKQFKFRPEFPREPKRWPTIHGPTT